MNGLIELNKKVNSLIAKIDKLNNSDLENEIFNKVKLQYHGFSKLNNDKLELL